MGYFEWSRADVQSAIKNAIANGRSSVALAMDHNTYVNELQVVGWARDMGYEVERQWERVVITLKRG